MNKKLQMFVEIEGKTQEELWNNLVSLVVAACGHKQDYKQYPISISVTHEGKIGIKEVDIEPSSA